MKDIPEIDLGVDRPDVPLIRRACESNGFFQISNHGISLEVQGEVLEMARKLFSLPEESKKRMSLSLSPKKRGYSALEQQQLDPKGAPDMKESFYISEDTLQSGNLYPSETDIPNFRSVMAAYYGAMIQLSQRIFRLLALSLGLAEEFFDRYSGADGNISSTYGSTLRLVHYPPGKHIQKANQLSCGAHTDFGTLTLLLQDGTSGLEVFDRASREWSLVAARKDVYVVNIGDLMQRWTNGIFVSAPHRVKFNALVSRYSIPFFFNGNYEYEIRVPEEIERRKECVKYEPITVGEHIKRRLKLSHVDLENGA